MTTICTKTIRDYAKIQTELGKLERKHKLRGLCDPVRDMLHVAEMDEVSNTAPDYWEHMCDAAYFGAGMTCEGEGLNINKLLGRPVY